MAQGHQTSRDTTIILCGLEIDVTVDFTIYSWGSSASWDDPGDPAELEIDRVTAMDTDLDLTHVLDYRDLWDKPNRFGVYPTIGETIENELHENLHEHEVWFDD